MKRKWNIVMAIFLTLGVQGMLLIPFGASAATLTTGRPMPLDAVYMTNARDGWGLITVRTRPKFVRTSDGGHRWTRTNEPPIARASQWSFDALSGLDAWVVIRAGQTDRVYATQDQGRTWRLLSAVKDAESFANLDFVTPERGFLLTNGYPATVQMIWHLYSTQDGGQSWRLISSSFTGTHAIPGSAYGDFTFTGPDTGWMTGINPVVTGTADIAVTRNGGAYWRHRTIRIRRMGKTMMSTLYPPTFFNESAGVMPVSLISPPWIGYSAALLNTRDTGAHWGGPIDAQYLRSTLSPVFDVLNARTTYTVVTPSRKTGLLYVTHDTGRTWRAIGGASVLASFDWLQFATPRVGFAEEANSDIQARPGGWSIDWPQKSVRWSNPQTPVWTTTDGGKTWHVLSVRLG